MDDEVPVSLIIEDGQSDEFGLEELCRHTKRVLWLSVRDGRRVVYKGLPENLRNHVEEVASLRKEYSLGLRIDCEGVVRFYSFEMHPQLGAIIVMEYVDGYTLHDYLREHLRGDANLPALEDRLKISIDIAKSLAVMHCSGILHRDLKPDNILIRKRDLHAKIIDFGNADADDFMIYKKSVGTEQYGSPEQHVPSQGSMASDIYSFGKILEELLPERRYRAIIDACISTDEYRRPTAKWVSDRLSHYRTGTLRWIWIIGGVVVLLSLAVLLELYLSNIEHYTDNVRETVLTKIDSISGADAIETGSADIEKTDSIPKLSKASVTRMEDIKPRGSTNKSEIVASTTDHNITETINAIVDKYAREADNINKRYGKLSYTDNIEENQQLRIKRGNEHYALSDNMDKELADSGIDKSHRHDAYLQLWTHIVFETNRIDGVDSVREKFLQQK
ncbi:MAG: protein kinase [Paramuribaculum sp.]|nr:protein kinase [Paramuribaculum sp.]